MQTELTYEPRCALNGGEDGLAFYRRFCTEMGRHLSDKAVSLFEVGQGQAEDVRRIFSTVYSKAAIDTIRDLSGTERVVRMRI